MSHRFHKIIICSTCLLLSLASIGCSSKKEQELSSFSASIESFSKEIKEKNDAINQIDTSSDSASEDMLSLLDDLDESFKGLAELNVPDQYISIDSLADEASENMSQAVSFYHSAFGSDEYNEEDADVAYQYYTRAMTRINYIGMILNGEVPEGENVTVYEEDQNADFIDQITE